MEIKVTHSTSATVLLEIEGLKILTDPIFDEGVKSYELGPNAVATRRLGPAIDIASLKDLDVVLLSHSHHADNLDEAGTELAQSAKLIITGPKRVDKFPGAIVLRPWESTAIEHPQGYQIKVTATPAVHGPWFLPHSHEVIGFVLEWRGQTNGPLYITGDTTSLWQTRKLAGRFSKIGTVILHMGGAHFWPPWLPFFRFSFTAYKAAIAASILDPRTIIPVHYEQSVWSHFRETIDMYRHEFADRGLTSRVQWLLPGVPKGLEV